MLLIRREQAGLPKVLNIENSEIAGMIGFKRPRELMGQR